MCQRSLLSIVFRRSDSLQCEQRGANLCCCAGEDYNAFVMWRGKGQVIGESMTEDNNNQETMFPFSPPVFGSVPVDDFGVSRKYRGACDVCGLQRTTSGSFRSGSLCHKRRDVTAGRLVLIVTCPSSVQSLVVFVCLFNVASFVRVQPRDPSWSVYSTAMFGWSVFSSTIRLYLPLKEGFNFFSTSSSSSSFLLLLQICDTSSFQFSSCR